MESTDVKQLKKYRSVVQLKSDSNYQQRYVSTRNSPVKAISPTHERVQRKRLSSQDEFLPTVKISSEYYSMTQSSDYSEDELA